MLNVNTLATRLRYRDGADWMSIPEWAEYCVDLGSKMAEFDAKSERLVVGLFAPVRDYVAVLAALGLVLERVAEAVSDCESEQHFERLSCLAKDAPVLYHDGQSVLKARFDSIAVRRGVTYIIVRTTKMQKKIGDWTTRVSVPKSDCRRIQLDGPAAVADDLGLNPTEAVTGSGGDVIRHLFSESGLPAFAVVSRSDCVVVGAKSTISEDLKVDICVISPDGKRTGATLGSILTMGRNAVGCSSRFDTISERAKPGETGGGENAPHTVIFDGPTAFVKQRGSFSASNWLVVMDANDLHVSEAAEEFRNYYLSDRTSDSERLILDLTPPRSMEMRSFAVSRPEAML